MKPNMRYDAPWGYRQVPGSGLVPDEQAMGQLADEENFGTPNFLGGPGGAAGYNFQKFGQALASLGNLSGRSVRIDPRTFGLPDEELGSIVDGPFNGVRPDGPTSSTQQQALRGLKGKRK